MKTAISLPNDLFVMADEFAKNLGISRSELIATALREFIKIRQRNDLTEKINAACAKLDTTLPEDLARVSRQKLLEVEW
jgi:metal-responsive CopG/Arc/MetJ family transcriptional regulator